MDIWRGGCPVAGGGGACILCPAAECEPVLHAIIDNSPDTITVSFTGIAPDLFREGQGVVAIGSFDASGKFTARQVLAKHDENYQPRELRPLGAGPDQNAS